jgi:DNA repair protein RadC
MKAQTAIPNTVKIKDAAGRYRSVDQDRLILQAKACIEERFKAGIALTTNAASEEYLKVLIGDYEREVFYVVWLNNQHEVIKHGILFEGTIDGSMVHPREVLKDALSCNAAAGIFAHNHPSGHPEPSQADISITRRLKNALALIDIRVLDHIVVGSTVTSLASRGLL